MNRSHFDQLPAQERLDEVADLLATGLMRVLWRKSSPVCGHIGESSLHIPPDQSGHPKSVEWRMSDG